jgi:hypothetical protein
MISAIGLFDIIFIVGGLIVEAIFCPPGIRATIRGWIHLSP